MLQLYQVQHLHLVKSVGLYVLHSWQVQISLNLDHRMPFPLLVFPSVLMWSTALASTVIKLMVMVVHDGAVVNGHVELVVVTDAWCQNSRERTT